ncbi:HTH-type transcriptional activator TipA [Streptomyces sp. YIM 130001]|uniref:MerR family transcriptional regulator n=1 Tax=Streptomyces sp. YIM 130001 TaxID=2259644 RepID=UPI000E651EA9|nr:MerR family transcriptional regulator [Streptomyces sp. YIM 130001]RII12443.1 HTH-type transcriptional activator TipA [Streptomyces sp. YIM 130001]
MSYTVGRVADVAGVMVRTLHHYDEIGLLNPSGRSGAGHRRYDDRDLDRLQQILFYRELGFSLGEVAALLDDPEVDLRDHLRRRHEVLTGRIRKLQQMAEAVETAMEARKMGINLTPEEKFEVFGGAFDADGYAEEAEERWGGTDAYRESQRRTGSYSKEDWQRIQAEADDLNRRFAESLSAGSASDSEAATDLAEAHRQHIRRYYYDCTYEIHRGLAGMYVDDPRFTAAYENVAPGLAAYVSEAILANAARRA